MFEYAVPPIGTSEVRETPNSSSAPAVPDTLPTFAA